jgi:hypothetical protein
MHPSDRPQGQVWWSKSREEPWRAKKQRRPVNQDQSYIRENRDDTISGAGPRRSCSFFTFHDPEISEHQSLTPTFFEAEGRRPFRDDTNSRINQIAPQAQAHRSKTAMSTGNQEQARRRCIFHFRIAQPSDRYRAIRIYKPLNALSKLSKHLAECCFESG